MKEGKTGKMTTTAAAMEIDSAPQLAPSSDSSIAAESASATQAKKKSFTIYGEEEASDEEYDDDEDEEGLYGDVGNSFSNFKFFTTIFSGDGDNEYYDEDLDEKVSMSLFKKIFTVESQDAKWVRNKHLEHNGMKVPKDDTEAVPDLKFKTDAILSCPCCFHMVCMDCQKHVKYNQFRAMFVQNCVVDFDTTLQPKNGEAVHPVSCATCKVWPISTTFFLIFPLFRPKLECMTRTRSTTFLT